MQEEVHPTDNVGVVICFLTLGRFNVAQVDRKQVIVMKAMVLHVLIRRTKIEYPITVIVHKTLKTNVDILKTLRI